ncbi:endonuclease/exonuclease/phosphatase family protein [Ornithinimicrobium humiphilum]|uniref:Endonuclease/exonuclease/phosphatase family metal-dependent hydrolase n=1 Tax=Ornithinimicrobium humiphilum TaxID=125288 RepID=A0A543KN40_9MICO|nr:endonuclease/exonuclease/phosphatase family protein [Ornithinimicrobium humiphilum]TQM96492.1 endonuclease/exonuclease/phosphatase family metal-dependent hydrolase [Ornithinimicrobium humiphilum]
MPHPPAPDALRVASYNLRGLKDDARAAAAVVRAISPDVLLLQEVPRYPGSDYAITSFARRAGLLWSGRTRMVSGTGLMTSLRVLSSDSRDRKLKVGLRENPRSYTVATITTPDRRTVTAVSIHLPLKGEQRVEHVGTVLRELSDDLSIPEDAPLVVGGDLNEDDAGPAWGVVAARLQEVSDDRPTFPAASPHRRIDAIFARGHASVVPGDPALLDGLALAGASDHVPVWVDLTFG